MKQLFIFILLCCFCGLSAATGDYTYRRNIPYRAVPSGDAYTDSVCRLDVAVPKGVTHAPVVVWFHGGGLTGGSRELPEPLLNGKLVVVGVEYRLSPKATIQEILDDALRLPWLGRWIAWNIMAEARRRFIFPDILPEDI